MGTKKTAQDQEVTGGKDQVVADEQATATGGEDRMMTVELTRDELEELVRYHAGFIFDSDRWDKCCLCMDGLLEDWRLMAWKRLGYFRRIMGNDAVMKILDDECQCHLEEREDFASEDGKAPSGDEE